MSEIRNTQTTMRCTDEHWQRIFPKKQDIPTEENKENQENDVNNTLQVEIKDDTETIS